MKILLIALLACIQPLQAQGYDTPEKVAETVIEAVITDNARLFKGMYIPEKEFRDHIQNSPAENEEKEFYLRELKKNYKCLKKSYIETLESSLALVREDMEAMKVNFQKLEIVHIRKIPYHGIEYGYLEQADFAIQWSDGNQTGEIHLDQCTKKGAWWIIGQRGFFINPFKFRGSLESPEEVANHLCDLTKQLMDLARDMQGNKDKILQLQKAIEAFKIEVETAHPNKGDGFQDQVEQIRKANCDIKTPGM